MLYIVPVFFFILGYILGSRYSLTSRKTGNTIEKDIIETLSHNRSRIISPSKVHNDRQLEKDLND